MNLLVFGPVFWQFESSSYTWGSFFREPLDKGHLESKLGPICILKLKSLKCLESSLLIKSSTVLSRPIECYLRYQHVRLPKLEISLG